MQLLKTKTGGWKSASLWVAENINGIVFSQILFLNGTLKISSIFWHCSAVNNEEEDSMTDSENKTWHCTRNKCVISVSHSRFMAIGHSTKQLESES